MMPALGEQVQRRRRGLTARLIELFSSIWLGIVLATLLFAYCSIGSAYPAFRQLPFVELTEFEWFHWWPFNLLILLFCANLVVATLRRIPLRTVNAGVWMIHAGIITLALGSYYYFGTKVEGDAIVFRRAVRVEVPGGQGGESVVALPGSSLTANGDGGAWRFQVDSTNPSWPILSDEHKGEKAYAVNVRVSPPGGEPFVRQLLEGYPQYTEDVIPGKGRAIKSLGRKLVNRDVALSLELHPTEHFHVMQTWALYVRRVGEREWAERPIKGLPRYNEHVASRDQVYTERRQDLPVRPLDLEVRPGEGTDALQGASVRITGYLPYAQPRQQWRDGGEVLNPWLRFTLSTDHTQPQSFDLMAFDRRRSRLDNGLVAFRWVDEPAGVSEIKAGREPTLTIEVPDTETEVALPLNAETVRGRAGEARALEGTPFKYRVLAVHNDLVIPNSGNLVSVVMLELHTPEGTFTRMVADQPHMTRDMHAADGDPHGGGGATPEASDPRIVTTYLPGTASVIFAAHPDGLDVVYADGSGQPRRQRVRAAEDIEVSGGVSVRVDSYMQRAWGEVKPYIVPRRERRDDVGTSFATIRLEVDTGQGLENMWLPYHHYVMPDANYSYGGRFEYRPQRVRLAGGSWAEVVFSRERRRLPNAIALENFELDTHIGGYTGSASTIRNYVSNLRFQSGAGWSDPKMIKVNAPTENAGYWCFQSTWDKPTARDPSGGMNYTGLGVGNRNGVWVQLAGCTLAVIGMLFAFYVKPVLKRRRAAHSRARIAMQEPEACAAEHEEAAVVETESVQI
ncbi:MAG: hypothetical protein PVI86_02350 [Phycisphaerae bacterium]|jgi:hypothetical protein